MASFSKKASTCLDQLNKKRRFRTHAHQPLQKNSFYQPSELPKVYVCQRQENRFCFSEISNEEARIILLGQYLHCHRLENNNF